MFDRAFNYLSTIGIADVFDILIVALVIYEVLMLIRRSNSSNLAKGLLLFAIALWLSAVLKLTMVNFILKKGVELGLIAVLILFQPEIRRTLERVGSRLSTRNRTDSGRLDDAISQVVLAASEMSSSKTGALIIFERKMRLGECISSGTILNADVSDELLKNIFFNKAPLHDGAVIIREGKIAAAGCILPLTKSNNLSKDLGLRHRAGIGLSEQSDAVVVIVSEETGSISLAVDGMLKRHLKASILDKLLRKELLTEEDTIKGGFNLFRLLESVITNGGGERSDEKDI